MKIRAMLACAALTVTAGVTGAGPAHAASTTPWCNDSTTTPVGSGWYVNHPSVRTRTGEHYPACYLRYGDRGRGVSALQRQLAFCYGFDLSGTGYYGDKTRAAVEKVQRLHGITVDGVFGPQTFKAMRWREFTYTDGYRETSRCYRPFAGRTLAAAPGPGAYSPFCDDVHARYAGNGWWVDLPSATTRTGASHFGCYLEPGDNVWSVARLQINLRECYNASVTVSGVYGTQTRAAVARVQQLHGLAATGVYDPALMKAMRWKLRDSHWHQSVKCYSPF
ncbi:MAG TPA: peptidoglycan-binding domain-containing protein [Kribbellaceae bacterium]